MNKVILVGIIKKDPFCKNTGAPCELVIETRDQWKGDRIEGKNNIEYHDVIVWGGKGDWALNNLVKGDKVLVEGFLKHSSFSYPLKDKNGKIVKIDGEEIILKRKVSEIKAKNIQKI